MSGAKAYEPKKIKKQTNTISILFISVISYPASQNMEWITANTDELVHPHTQEIEQFDEEENNIHLMLWTH